MADTVAAGLRELSAHRGLKLLVSRRRKPGGDFGKFGLTDLGGKALLGIGPDGLTASAQDIEDFLRSGAEKTWKTSAEVTPARAAVPAAKARTKDDIDEARTRPRSAISSNQRPRKARASAKANVASVTRPDAAVPTPHDKRVASGSQRETRADHDANSGRALVVRKAKAADGAALDALLTQLATAGTRHGVTAAGLKAAMLGRGGVIVADCGTLVGCCAWTVIPTLQHGEVGRLTIILVDQRHRRRGIGRAMVDEARAALQKGGCDVVEVMSDIEIKNAHNFFRSLGFEQTSYRFARQL